MEADWEFEADRDAPVLEADWPGFVDLRKSPERAGELGECSRSPGLKKALVRLNSAASPVWTSKCDIWTVREPDAIDADELDAPADRFASIVSIYIDLLPKWEGESSTIHPVMAPDFLENLCREFCARAKLAPLRCSRVDFVIRRAAAGMLLPAFGISAYITACGASIAEAMEVLDSALDIIARAVCAHSTLQ